MARRIQSGTSGTKEAEKIRSTGNISSTIAAFEAVDDAPADIADNPSLHLQASATTNTRKRKSSAVSQTTKYRQQNT